ncbi:MAG: S41 family peptidase [Bdellovibrionales bacterium]
MMKSKKFIFSIGLASMLILVITSENAKTFAEDRYEELQLFTKVLNLVQKYYVEDVDSKKLLHGGIKGMLNELDPHTNFLPADIYQEFESETQGRFGGLGIEITVQMGVLTVISPIEDTPAWKAGIKAGDKIVSIDGESTKGLSLVEAAQKMRGKKGSTVKLVIYREGFTDPNVISVKRGDVIIKSVKYTNLEDGYAYFKLTSFIENTSEDFKKLLDSHMKRNKTLKGLILDLRKNPGGLLDQAIKMSDLFLPEGTIVSTKGRSDTEYFYAKKRELWQICL